MKMANKGRSRGFDLSLISKYRSEMFGISIILIMIFHYSADVVAVIDKGIIEESYYPGPFYWLIENFNQYVGSIGVEIFAFLSGVGLYYSYSKDPRPGNFYIKRLKRVLVPYLIVAVLFWGIKDLFIKKLGFAAFLQDITFITLFTKGTQSIWFVGYILLMYLIYPAVHKLVNGKHGAAAALFLLAITTLAPEILFRVDTGMYYHVQIAFTRIPVFIAGCYMAHHIKDGFKLKKIVTFIFIAVSFALFLYLAREGATSLEIRRTAALYGIALIFVFCYALKAFEESGIMRRVLRLAGDYSLELYLTHVTMRNLMKSIGLHSYDPLQYMVMILIAIAASFALKILVEKINELLGKITQNV